jgi:cholesterol transport system auxiliary component
MNHMRNRNLFTIPLMLLALSGCAVFSAPEPPQYVHLQLEGAGASIERADGKTDATLLVSALRAAPGFATPGFAYIQRDRELRYFARHEWIAEPTHMMLPAVVRALDQTGRFDAVISPPSSANAQLRLDLELTALYQDFRVAGGSEAVLSVRAQIVDPADRSVVATRVFELREPAAADNPLAGAAAADRALARLLEQLAAFCVDES